jgi:pimeloyl-ACP methyl ester carboxylesterase
MPWLRSSLRDHTGGAWRTLEARRHRAGRRPLRAGALLLALVVSGAPATPQSGTLKVGSLTLHRCATAAPWCGTLQRPLDPSGAVPGTLAIYFEYYPHTTSGPATGTLVPAEGGPGFPSTESRADFLALYAPLRASRDVLIMDYRGTGRSGALDCRELQNATALTETNIGACGAQLGRSAPLYSSAQAADDLAALLQALSIRQIDLYGESYGSYFAQVFALRHAAALRSLVLDGADALEGPDFAWYPSYAPAMRDKFNLACARDPGCAALPGNSLQHLAPALAQLRAHPSQAQVRYGAGRTFSLSADASALAILMYGSWPPFAGVRETDAAARAYAEGDPLPLQRLMAEALTGVDSRDPSHNARKFSAALAAVVSCLDPPQIFDMRLEPAQRLLQRDQLVAARERAHPDMFAPFTFSEYRHMPLDYTFIDQCVRWPAVAAPLIVPTHPYPDIPVLVVSGELDNLTSVSDGLMTASRFPHAHHVIIANSFHVNALPRARSDCGALLVRHFIATLATGDESCAAGVPPVRLVPRFARTLALLAPAHAQPGNEASDRALRAVSAALLSSEDVISRAMENGAGPGMGLRGGRFTAVDAEDGYRLTLSGVRWTEDLTVSGRIDWPGRTGLVRAQLQLQGAVNGALQLSWPEGGGAPLASVHGTLDGANVVAEAPAP